jgi:hypothetical protein
VTDYNEKEVFNGVIKNIEKYFCKKNKNNLNNILIQQRKNTHVSRLWWSFYNTIKLPIRMLKKAIRSS